MITHFLSLATKQQLLLVSSTFSKYIFIICLFILEAIMDSIVGNSVVSTQLAEKLALSDLKSCLLVVRDWGGLNHPFRQALYRRSVIRFDRRTFQEAFHPSMSHFFYNDIIQPLDKVGMDFWSKVGPSMRTLKICLRFDGRNELDGLREILAHLKVVEDLILIFIILKDYDGQLSIQDSLVSEARRIIQSFEELKNLETLQIIRGKSDLPIQPAVFNILNEMFKTAFTQVRTIKWDFGAPRSSVIKGFVKNWDAYVKVVRENCPRIKNIAAGVNPVWFCQIVEFEVVVRTVRPGPSPKRQPRHPEGEKEDATKLMPK